MIEDPSVERDPREPIEAAESELARIRELLTAAGRGDADAQQVVQSLREYVSAHGPTLRLAAAALTEEVRRQTLDELYKWREQLNAQLSSRQTPSSSPDAPSPAGPAPSQERAAESP